MTARQASVGGAGAQTLLRWCAVTCWLAVAGCTVLVFTTGMPWWAGVLTEATMLLVVLPLGFHFWGDAGEHKADTDRLLATGRPAVAEVVDMEQFDTGDDHGKVAVLRLRVSGDHVPPFEASYRGDPGEEFRVGALLYATVDPDDNLFTLRRLGGARA